MLSPIISIWDKKVFEISPDTINKTAETATPSWFLSITELSTDKIKELENYFSNVDYTEHAEHVLQELSKFSNLIPNGADKLLENTMDEEIKVAGSLINLSQSVDLSLCDD